MEDFSETSAPSRRFGFRGGNSEQSKIRILLILISKCIFKIAVIRIAKKYRPDLERVLFKIYCGDDDEEAFRQAIKTFGASYDLIAYLFYIKDPGKYLPIHPRSFEKGLRQIGIDYKLERRCSWNNYIGFIDIISEIQQIMNEHLPHLSTMRKSGTF